MLTVKSNDEITYLLTFRVPFPLNFRLHSPVASYNRYHPYTACSPTYLLIPFRFYYPMDSNNVKRTVEEIYGR